MPFSIDPQFSSPYESKFAKLLLEVYGVRAFGGGPSSLSSMLELTSETSVPLPGLSVPGFNRADFLAALEVTSCHPSSLPAPSDGCPTVVKFSSLRFRTV